MALDMKIKTVHIWTEYGLAHLLEANQVWNELRITLGKQTLDEHQCQTLLSKGPNEVRLFSLTPNWRASVFST